MVYAQIIGGFIVNTADADNDDILIFLMINSTTAEPYDAVLRIDTLDPMPGIGWSFDGTTFSAPYMPPDDEESE